MIGWIVEKNSASGIRVIGQEVPPGEGQGVRESTAL